MQHKPTAQTNAHAKAAALPAMVKYALVSGAFMLTGGFAFYLSMM